MEATATLPLLTAEEVAALTGYALPGKQVQELRKQGFWRARRNAAGTVVLERAHYEAVCAGGAKTAEPDGPRLRLPTLRRAA